MGTYSVISTLRFGRTKTTDTAQNISDFYRTGLNYMQVFILILTNLMH